MGELSLEKDKVLALKREKEIFKDKNDQELVESISQILSEAQQYQEEAFTFEEEEEEEELGA